MAKEKVKTERTGLVKKFWAPIAILALVLAFAFPYWAKDRVPFPADYLVDAFPPWQYYFAHPVKNNAMPDVVGQMYPWKHLVINFWQQGIVPLWNPYNFSGTPFLANYQSAVFHPGNWLFFVLPEAEAWSLLILFQFLLAGWFTYLLARQLEISRPGAVLAAIAFMFCGFITVWGSYGTLAWAILWLPLVLYALDKSLKKPTFFSLVLVSFSLLASFFSGHFQTSIYLLLAALAYLFFQLIVLRKKKNFVLSLVFVLLGIGLALPQILPTWELYQLASRSKAFGISEIIPWQYWFTTLAPDFYGNPVTRNDWFGHYAEWSSFAGVIPLILAVYFVFSKKQKKSWFFVILLLGSFILARPTPLLDLIFKLKIPVLGNSAAARINSLFSFALAILAGFGLDQLYQDLKGKRFKPVFRVALFFLALVVGIWAWLLRAWPFDSQYLVVAKRNMVLPSGLVLAFVGLITAFYLTQKWFKNRKQFAAGLVLLILLVFTAFDLFRFAHKWMPFASREYLYPDLPILTFLQKLVGPDGVSVPDRVFGYLGMEMNNYYQLPGFDGYDPLYPQRYGELLMAGRHGLIEMPSTRGVSLGRRDQYTQRLMNLLGGRYFLHAVDDGKQFWEFNFWDYPSQFELIYQDEKYEVYENKKALPRVIVVNDYLVLKEDQEIVDWLLDEKNNLSKTIVLEEEPEKGEEIIPVREAAEIKVTTYSSNLIEVKVNNPSQGLLFLSDNFYPGWQALIDDQPTKIYRANYTFRAINLPSGAHLVKFTYQPTPFKQGVRVSLVCLGLIVVGAGLVSFSNKKK